MEEQLKTKIEEQIKNVLEQDINMNNIEYLYKLSKIKHMMKEDENMNYGNYGNYGGYNGRGPGHGSYGENYGEYRGYGNYGEGSYGRRGRDARYRGDDHLDRMYGEYGRYNENRGRYGAGNQETDKSFHYMVEAMKDFIKVLYEEAETPQQKEMLRQAIQQSMM